jgi:hypothetical protein
MNLENRNQNVGATNRLPQRLGINYPRCGSQLRKQKPKRIIKEIYRRENQPQNRKGNRISNRGGGSYDSLSQTRLGF